MRRGLIVWDPAEITTEALSARLQRLREAMTKAGVDGLILYTNFVRPGAVSYLTSFSPYWADGILLVTRNENPVFATSMSTRMAKWLRSVIPYGEIINTRQPGVTIGERMAKDGEIRKVAIPEMDALPAGIFDDLSARATSVTFVDGSEIFNEARREVDGTERVLLEKASDLAARGLARIDPASMQNAGTVVAVAEQEARLGGAEEVYVAIAPDADADPRLARMSGNRPLGRCFTVRASVAYKGAWVRRMRTYSADDAAKAAIARANEWFEAFARNFQPETPFAVQIEAAVAQLPDARLRSWLVESSYGTYPLRAIDSSAPSAGKSARAGDYLVITLRLETDGVVWQGATPVFVGESMQGQKPKEIAA